ncbi:MAG: hypothetical protein EXS38_12480 [Opitutus sp.]|nr:hypothetical protein [Opitutus sp.]
MGFFDRLAGKKPAPTAAPATPPATEPAASAPTGGVVKPRLTAARERLEAKDLSGALAIYEELLATAGDRADVLVTISGDLGSHGHVAEIVELVAPRYDADRHGPATGLNLLQAYLAARNADAAQHVLDILFSLNRPELEEQLHGFSNAIAELLLSGHSPLAPTAPGLPADGSKIGLITISKPIWFYGLEPLAAQVLPPKESRLRKIAFAQLALPGYADIGGAMKKPEDELGRLSRGLPLWLAETFYFSAAYAPVAAIGLMSPPQAPSHYVIFGAEWSTENLRQLVDTTEGGLDYIITGALRVVNDDYEATLRVWEVKSMRERKTFSARWTPATADAGLLGLHAQVRGYMEWSPASAAFAYTIPAKPRGWIDTLAASLGLFLAEKALLPATQLMPAAEDLQQAARNAATGEAASFGYLTLQARAGKLQLAEAPADVVLARSVLVAQAQKIGG